MNKIKFKGVSMKLSGVFDIVGKKLNIKAIDKDNNLKQLKDFGNNFKVISSFPKLNTSVCDKQTKKIAKLANKYKNIDFVSITMDSIKVIGKWCLANKLENVVILSDKEHQEFSKATNLLIPKLNMLARGLMILDQDNKVIETFYNQEITKDPNFDELENSFQNLLA